MEATLKFLNDYIEDNINGYQDGLDYVEKRGFVDSFGVERILTGIASRSFAMLFQRVLEGDSDESLEARIKYLREEVNEELVSTNIGASSSPAQNTMDIYKIREAQKLARNFQWWMSVDGAL